MPFSATVASSAFSAEKQMPFMPVAEQRAQLVLGGDHRDLGAGVGERREDACRARRYFGSFIITSAPASRSKK